MIKLTEKIGYGFGDMASSMFWKLFGAYLMIFYTDVSAHFHDSFFRTNR